MINFSKEQKIIIGLIGIIIISIIIYYMTQKIGNDEVVIENTESTEMEEEIEEEKIAIHMTGCVKNPGIIELEEGARIDDAIQLAGGLTEEADLTNVNLAYRVEDGQKIYIPSIHDIEEKEIIQENQEEIFGKENETGKVNINTAKQTELETLPGIGPTIALRIIEYRKENGEFTDIEELKEVEGIGEAKWEQIKDFVEI